jgi:hypothetical protein
MGEPLFEQHELGLSWLVDSSETMERACHAVRLDGKVWIVDPTDVPGLDERMGAVGEPAGVLQLLDRHDRDSAELAERYGVPHHRLPFEGIEGTTLEAVSVIRNKLWNEVAIWSPADRALIVPEAVGTARYFRAGGEAVGIHPMLRMLPPNRLRDYEPEHLLTGHGTGMHGPDTAAALRDALSGSRRRTPQAAFSILRSAIGR